MFRRKDKDAVPGAQVEKAVARAVNYEVTIADLAQRSARRAWWVATASLLMSLALAGGYYYMLPLKERVPFLVMADAYTGTATVATLTGNFEGQTITASDAINRSNVAQYVMARESYDYAVMGLRDWQLVHVMSSRPVSDAMRAFYARSNPQSPVNVYKTDRAIRVKILSITPMDAQPSGGFRAASVRIQRSIHDKARATTQYLDNQLVTLRFRYDGNLALSEHERILNPLGIEVFEYRVDNDYARGVPVPDQSALDLQAEQVRVEHARHAAEAANRAAGAAAAAQPIPLAGEGASPQRPGMQTEPEHSTGTLDGARGQ